MASFDLAGLLEVPELPSYLARVNDGLARVAASNSSFLQAPIARLLQVRGKRLRPALVIAVARSQDAPVTEAVISAAVAVELVHIASLIHDDIIDKATTRWGIPTINAQEGSAAAIVVGDFLLARALEQAAAVSAAAAELVAGAMAALCDGQARELVDQGNVQRSLESYWQTIDGKTAALLAAACQLGGLCAGLSKPQLRALATYGHHFGRAFQLIDDVLDFTSTPELSGKPTGNDVAEGVYTLPVLLALAGPAGKKVQTALASSPKNLVDLLLQASTLQKTVQKAQTHAQKAHQALQPLSNSSALATLPQTYLKWALQTQTNPRLSIIMQAAV